jgi:hypothetical protein
VCCVSTASAVVHADTSGQNVCYGLHGLTEHSCLPQACCVRVHLLVRVTASIELHAAQTMETLLVSKESSKTHTYARGSIPVVARFDFTFVLGVVWLSYRVAFGVLRMILRSVWPAVSTVRVVSGGSMFAVVSARKRLTPTVQQAAKMAACVCAPVCALHQSCSKQPLYSFFICVCTCAHVKNVACVYRKNTYILQSKGCVVVSGCVKHVSSTTCMCLHSPPPN